MTTAKYHISTKTSEAIAEVIGRFELVSFNCFDANGETRTRYTVKKPNGKKHIHIIGYPNGSMVLA